MPRVLPPLVIFLEVAAVAIGALAVLTGALAAALATRPARPGPETFDTMPAGPGTKRITARDAMIVIALGGFVLLGCGYLLITFIASEGNPPATPFNTAWHAAIAIAGILLTTVPSALRLRSAAPRLGRAFIAGVAGILVLLLVVT